MPILLNRIFKSLIAFVRQHLFTRIVGAIATAVLAAGGSIFVPPTTVEKDGWKTEIREHFGRIVLNHMLVQDTIPYTSGNVVLFWDNNLARSISNLQRAVYQNVHGPRSEFFFSDGEVEFVYRGRDATPAEEASDTAGDRLYFRRGARFRFPLSRLRMFDWVAAGRYSVARDQRDFHVKERAVLNDAREIRELARRSLRLTGNPVTSALR
jgi:hypothetical protein